MRLRKYSNDVQDLINHLKNTRPFNNCGIRINIYRVDVTSTDSGADDPVACGGTGATPCNIF